MGRDENGRRRANKAPLFSSLPADVIVNILKNLPVKILLRCRCVCKDWNSIITGQSFINTHLLSQPRGHLFCPFFERSVPSSSTSDETQLCSDGSLPLVYELKVPLPYRSDPSRIVVGSFDGLLCLTDWKPFGRELYLWNPSIKKCKTLSNSCLFDGKHRKRSPCPKTIAFGLGSRVLNSDYIIVRIALFNWFTRVKTNRPPQAELYSLSTESWKKVGVSEDLSKRLMDIRSRQCVNLHGDLNWLAKFSDREGRLYESILSFDVNVEEFREIRLPGHYKNGINDNFLRIEVYRGSLAVIISGKSIPDDGNKYVWLWVMEEYGKVDSWTRTVKARKFLSNFSITINFARLLTVDVARF